MLPAGAMAVWLPVLSGVILKAEMKSKSNGGFALIDTVLAIGLMAVALSFLGVIYSAARLSRVSRSDLLALYIAQNKIDELRNTPFANLAVQSNASFSNPNLSSLRNGQASYTVALFDANGDGTAESNIKKITVTVSWSQNSQIKSKTLTTLAGEAGLSP